MKLDEQIEQIQTRQDLSAFVQALAKDLEAKPEAWENDRLAAYLEAMVGWIQDMDGYFRNRGEPTPEQPSWKLIGYILMAAKIYE